jgi:hypothetical protein|nr:MAG TPA: hypothetical protein [Caudoviricetes sp.]
MKLLIKRFKDIDDATLGEFKLLKGDELIMTGYTLEPAGEDTIASGKDRRIPQGEYKAIPFESPRFKRTLPLVYNDVVPKSRRILIHHGNFPKDTEGCILLGASYDAKGVYQSRDTLEKFLTLIRGSTLDIEIRNAL